MPLVFAFSTFLSTSLGGWFALRNRDRLHLVLGFTAGVLLGLVAFDLLPELFRLSDATAFNVPVVMVALIAGFLSLHVVERSIALHAGHETEYGAHQHHPQLGFASATGLATHSFLDGVGIGLAFQVNEAVGLTVAIAVIAHDFADGINTVGVMLAHGNGVRRARWMLLLDALAPVLGAASTLLFSLSQSLLALWLGFFAGFLLYLATGDILPEAHSRHPSRLTLLCTFAGAGLMWLVVGLS